MGSPFSIVILTLNEEERLPRCLASLGDCDDILVVDSGSTDRTVEIAEQSGARVLENKFENFAQQRNFSLNHGALKNPWVFQIDADETFTPALWRECSSHQPDGDIDGVWVAPKMMWRGNWLKRCTDYPAWQARFVHRDRFEFIEVGHGQRESSAMRMTRFESNYEHDLSSEGVQGWLEKHRRYARAEAENFLQSPQPELSALWRGSALQRRRVIKHFSYRLPCRPALRFVYQYVLRGGFLDGRGAWEYCSLLARYEGYASAAIKELSASPNE